MRVICVVVHGRGQTPADMQDMIVGHLAVDGVRYVLPKSDGPGWYDARAVDPLTDATRAQVRHGVARIMDVIAMARAAEPDAALLLCGFSQWACLLGEALLAGDVIPDAACLFTGCRVGTAADALPLRNLGGLPVYASCGDADPWIPVDAHHRLLSDLSRAGARIRSDMFPGRAHTVNGIEIGVLTHMLRALADRRPILDT
ncbi:phospholipase/carboxylesterase [Loktanella fryxellensis]|uniref:Phospholipase/carboxylesterase n=1 Tax=Loktanella fryxellensis TaxID=245187 RepID=A0A1H8C144_9RHOB|nr:phospholipase/carboxylesterase [Loktanella fryxellensis]